MNWVSALISRASSAWSITSSAARALVPRAGATRTRRSVGEGREVVGAAAHRIEQRVVRLLDARLLARELCAPEQRRRAARLALREDLALPLVGAADLFVGRAARDAEHLVERGRPRSARRRRRRLGRRVPSRAVASARTRRAMRSMLRAPFDVGLSMSSGLAPAHREPDGVVVLDVAEVIEVDGQVLAGQTRMRRAELEIGAHAASGRPRGADADRELRRRGRRRRCRSARLAAMISAGSGAGGVLHARARRGAA